MSLFQSINSDELATTATLIAIAFSKVLNAEELNVLGNFIVAVGSLMTSIATQEQALKVENNKKESVSKSEKQTTEVDIEQQIKELQEQIKYLLQG